MNRAIDPTLAAITVQAVANLTANGVQPTVRQVTRSLGLSPDGAAKPLLTGAVQSGALTHHREWIEAAKGVFDVYRLP